MQIKPVSPSPGAKSYRPVLVRLKLLTTGLASASCFNLSVSCLVASRTNSSLVTFQKKLHGAAFEEKNGCAPTTPHTCALLHTTSHIFSPRAGIQGMTLELNFLIIASTFGSTRDFKDHAKSRKRPARHPNKARCHFKNKCTRRRHTLVQSFP